MFERTLQDLIRGLRAHKASSKAQEDAFLAEALAEIKDELKGNDMALKAGAVLKVCYLMMLYPVPPPSGFAFHVVEIMSSPRYHLKQLGYLAAPMAFSGDTEEVVLTVNGIKKDLLSPHLALPPLPLAALPHLLSLSSSLSHTLHPDLLLLLTHSSPRIRKRAVLCLLPCWEAFPEGLREGFSRLRERLSDEDQGVVGATVGVVMELARRQGGKNYLPLAPELFGILTGSSNNWMLIKVIKLFAILTPLEPRLVRKLLPPITSLISSTSAISLLYECVRTCIVGGMLDPDRAEGEALARVCVDKLGGYLRDEGGDQNLRYIALLAMVKIIPTHPHMISEYQEEIMQSLDDPDVSIRIRALELVSSMVDNQNLRSIVDQLLAHLVPASTSAATTLPKAAASLAAIANTASATEDPNATSARISLSSAYRLLLTQRLLAMIDYDSYAHVTDFDWVISVLIDVAYVSNVDVSDEIQEMLLDVVGRVKRVRQFAVGVLEKTLSDDDLREKSKERGAESGLLQAATWICGEYAEHLNSSLSAISAILAGCTDTSPSSTVAISLQAISKIFAQYCSSSASSWSPERHAEMSNLVRSIHAGVSPLSRHPDIEVQERAVEISQLLSFVEADIRTHITPLPKLNTDTPSPDGGFDNGHENPPYPKSLFLFQPLFSTYELNAIALEAQESIAPPDGVDMDHDFVPGGGFPVDLDHDDLAEDDDLDLGPGPSNHLGQNGGKGMEELQRVLREQAEEDEVRRKGRRAKGKAKKGDGELTAEERVEKEKRRAARKAKAKSDPYYLYDDKDDKDERPLDDDVDEIPIVKLDDGEMKETSSTLPSSKNDALQSETDGLRQISRPDDVDDEGELPGRKVLDGETAGHIDEKAPYGTGLGDVEVVKVKRKKKREGDKKRRKEVAV